jgi:dipeptidyl aminopeptidase/acylaminoacyl peptidase
MGLKRFFCCALVGLLPAGGVFSQTPASPLPPETFFADWPVRDVKLSPSGRSVAMSVRGPNGRKRLVVVDLATMEPRPAFGFSDGDVGWLQWLNDERLVFGAEVHADWYNRRFTTGLHAVNRDGSGYRQLLGSSSDVGRIHFPAGATLHLGSQGAQRDNWIYVAEPDPVPRWGPASTVSISRVNTDTSEVQRLDAPRGLLDFLVDTEGRPQAALKPDGSRSRLFVRDADRWRQVGEFDRFDGTSIKPLFIGPDGSFYVSAPDARRTQVLHTLDPRSGKLSDKPLLAVAGFDLEPSFIANDDKVLGIRFPVDAEVTQWWDEGMKAVQAAVDQRLPGAVNRITPPRRGDSPWVLVTNWSDQQPTRWFAWHRTERRLALLANGAPQIKPEQMAQTDFVRIKARDGLELPVYVTRPPGSEGRRLPVVVWVHGGPWVRGAYWGWRAEWQFLASRGYLVVAPEFRGSTGFGHAHFAAGLREWGGRMQDDLVDSAHWAVASAGGDSARVCSVGESYGGYAAIMTLVRDAEVFKCAVSLVGVTDPLLLFDEKWSFVPADFREMGLPRLIGDPEKDAERLKSASPVHQARHITAPLLLAWGAQDGRVPTVHAERLVSALKGHHKTLETVRYEDEGHGLDKPANRVDFWTRVEKFLARSIPPR